MKLKHPTPLGAAIVGIVATTLTACSASPETTLPASGEYDHTAAPSANSIASEAGNANPSSVDLVATTVERDGSDLIFHAHVYDIQGAPGPEAVGQLDGAPVWSYVWPTSLDSSTVGFEAGKGILALAATSHPDFDDTPLYDEDGDGATDNDGGLWHAHWVVLGENDTCGGGLAVIDIPEGEVPALPQTWPGLPILLDSPELDTWTSGEGVMVRIPSSAIGDREFQFDGVTAGLRVSTSPHDPLLCVEDVWDVASGDLSLPGLVEAS